MARQPSYAKRVLVNVLEPRECLICGSTQVEMRVTVIPTPKASDYKSSSPYADSCNTCGPKALEIVLKYLAENPDVEGNIKYSISSQARPVTITEKQEEETNG